MDANHFNKSADIGDIIKKLMPKRSPGQVAADWLLPKIVDKPLLFGPHQAPIRSKWRAMNEALEGLSGDDLLKERAKWMEGSKGLLDLKGGGAGTLKYTMRNDRENVRNAQTDAIKTLLDWGLIGGGGIGLGIGAMRQAPKLMKTRRDIAAIDMPEDEDKKKRRSPLSTAIFGKSSMHKRALNVMPKVDTGASEPTSGDGKEFLPGLSELLATSLGQGKRLTGSHGMGAPMPYSGAMWPLLPATAMAALIGGDKLTDYVTDKLRSRYIDKRKKKVRNQFYSLLDEDIGVNSKRAGLAAALDAMADEYTEKSAGLPAGAALGALTSILAVLGGTSLGLGYNISKGRDPLAQKAKALKLIMARERLKRNVPLELVSSNDLSPEELRSVLGQAAGTTYRMPLMSAGGADDDAEDKKDADIDDMDLYGLGKMSALRKSAEDPLPTGPVYTSGQFAKNFLTTNPLDNLGKSVGYVADKVGGPAADRLGGRAADKAVETFKADPEVAQLRATVDKLRAATEGRDLNKILDTAQTATKDYQKFRDTATGMWSGIKGGFGEGVKQIGGLLDSAGGSISNALVGSLGPLSATGSQPAGGSPPVYAAQQSGDVSQAPDVTPAVSTPSSVPGSTGGQTISDVATAQKGMQRTSKATSDAVEAI